MQNAAKVRFPPFLPITFAVEARVERPRRTAGMSTKLPRANLTHLLFFLVDNRKIDYIKLLFTLKSPRFLLSILPAIHYLDLRSWVRFISIGNRFLKNICVEILSDKYERYCANPTKSFALLS